MLRRSKHGYVVGRGALLGTGVAGPKRTVDACFEQETTVMIVRLVELVRSIFDETNELQRAMKKRYPHLGE